MCVWLWGAFPHLQPLEEKKKTFRVNDPTASLAVYHLIPIWFTFLHFHLLLVSKHDCTYPLAFFGRWLWPFFFQTSMHLANKTVFDRPTQAHTMTLNDHRRPSLIFSVPLFIFDTSDRTCAKDVFKNSNLCPPIPLAESELALANASVWPGSASQCRQATLNPETRREKLGEKERERWCRE